MILVGNKIDMKREVSTEEGKKMAESFGIKYFETSAKENIGINESMQEIISMSYGSKKVGEKETIVIESNNNTSSSGCKC
jgi:GTPase SAR1 family protein